MIQIKQISNPILEIVDLKSFNIFKILKQPNKWILVEEKILLTILTYSLSSKTVLIFSFSFSFFSSLTTGGQVHSISKLVLLTNALHPSLQKSLILV